VKDAVVSKAFISKFVLEHVVRFEEPIIIICFIIIDFSLNEWANANADVYTLTRHFYGGGGK